MISMTWLIQCLNKNSILHIYSFISVVIIRTVFSDCLCAGHVSSGMSPWWLNNKAETGDHHELEAVQDFCPSSCDEIFYITMAFISIVSFLGSTARVGSSIINLRVVQPWQDRTGQDGTGSWTGTWQFLDNFLTNLSSKLRSWTEKTVTKITPYHHHPTTNKSLSQLLSS